MRSPRTVSLGNRLAPHAGRGRNALLAALPAEEMTLLAPALQPVELPFKLVLEEPGQPVGRLWFPHTGVLSMLSEMEDGASVEVATIGREGFVGLPLLLDATRLASRVIIQIPGHGDRLAAADFALLIPRLPTLHRLMLRYAAGLVTQISQGSACNRLHAIEQRCARWLLMTHDRVDGDEFPLTQEFLAHMLGVARPSVSIAEGVLQKAGLIAYTRGVVRVLDRPGLEAASCECYRVIAGEFRHLIGTAG